MINLILYPVSIIPTILIIVWLLKKVLVEEDRHIVGKDALMFGFKSTLWTVLFSFTTVLIRSLLLRFLEDHYVAKTFYHCFITLALCEEIAKGFMLQKLIKKHNIDYSWLDIIIYMVLISIGFSVLESGLYALMTNAGQIIVRGLTFPHLDYGLFMGYFVGKAMKDKNKFNYFWAIFIPWFMHGLYDFCLDEKISEMYEISMYPPVILAFLGLVFAVVFVVFVAKHKSDAKYTVIVKEKSQNI